MVDTLDVVEQWIIDIIVVSRIIELNMIAACFFIVDVCVIRVRVNDLFLFPDEGGWQFFVVVVPMVEIIELLEAPKASHRNISQSYVANHELNAQMWYFCL